MTYDLSAYLKLCWVQFPQQKIYKFKKKCLTAFSTNSISVGAVYKLCYSLWVEGGGVSEYIDDRGAVVGQKMTDATFQRRGYKIFGERITWIKAIDLLRNLCYVNILCTTWVTRVPKCGYIVHLPIT